MKLYSINNWILFNEICSEYTIDPNLALENNIIVNLLKSTKENKSYKQCSKDQKQLREILLNEF
tara:strand:+ start:350 stop:541 length:192 start_codon:yes stop_codon:yes gene_type:complete